MRVTVSARQFSVLISSDDDDSQRLVPILFDPTQSRSLRHINHDDVRVCRLWSLHAIPTVDPAEITIHKPSNVDRVTLRRVHRPSLGCIRFDIGKHGDPEQVALLDSMRPLWYRE